MNRVTEQSTGKWAYHAVLLVPPSATGRTSLDGLLIELHQLQAAWHICQQRSGSASRCGIRRYATMPAAAGPTALDWPAKHEKNTSVATLLCCPHCAACCCCPCRLPSARSSACLSLQVASSQRSNTLRGLPSMQDTSTTWPSHSTNSTELPTCTATAAWHSTAQQVRFSYQRRTPPPSGNQTQQRI